MKFCKIETNIKKEMTKNILLFRKTICLNLDIHLEIKLKIDVDISQSNKLFQHNFYRTNVKKVLEK